MAKAAEKSRKSEAKTMDLNVRDFPEDVWLACKHCALDQRVHLREFVIKTLREAVQNAA